MIETIERLAAGFWEDVGEEEPFPRSLELAFQCPRVPVAVKLLPRLCPRSVQEWLRAQGHAVSLMSQHRWLNGCLYARDGKGFMFVEAALTTDHQRVVTAHELAHFLAHYDLPRRRAERRLGRSLLPVLDGKRPATVPEQLAATLAGVCVEPFVHFMDRTADGAYAEPVSEIERTADELGLELLAPWRVVFAIMRSQSRWPGPAAKWESVLTSRFRLPDGWAEHYAARLIRRARGRLSFSQALGL